MSHADCLFICLIDFFVLLVCLKNPSCTNRNKKNIGFSLVELALPRLAEPH